MSDYLSGLAARSLASTDVVLPRLASRFEPAPGDGLFPRAPASRLDGLARGLEDFAELAPETAPPASRRRMASQIAAPALPSFGGSTPGQPNDETLADTVSSRPRRDSQVATIVAPASQSVSRLSHAVRSPEPAARPGIATSIQPVSNTAASATRQGASDSLVKPQVGESVRPPDRPLDMAEVPGLDQRIRSAVGDALAGEHAQDAVQDHTPPQVVTSDVQPTAPARVIAQPQVAIATAAKPAPPATVGRFRAQQERPPTPTIHVTIGRIEVRATSAHAAASTSKPRPAPTMSLDDYLRQRNGGSR